MTRERGILTEKQRAYLELDEEKRHKQYSRQQRYRLRKSIRQRVRNGLLDFHTLFNGLDDEELAEIFVNETEMFEAGGGKDDDDGVREFVQERLSGEIKNVPAVIGTPAAIGFLARVWNLDGQPVIPHVEPQPAFENFTESLEKGLRRYIAQSHRLNADVSVSIEVTDAEPVDDLVERMESGDAEIDPYVLTALEHAGVTGEDLAQLVEQVRNDDE